MRRKLTGVLRDLPTDADAARPRDQGIGKLFAAWWRRDDGVSAVEFAFIAPALFFGLVTTVDLGLALNERMTIDHVLRAGAQRAMADPGASAVLDVLNATAEKNFTLATNNVPPVPNPLAVSVNKFCACPESTGVAVACSTICAGPKPTHIYYRLSGQKTYLGMIIPPITARPSVQVQVR